MANITFEKLPDENEEQFIWRIGQAKDAGIIDLEWTEIADIINKQFREDESEYRSEAAYRKPYQQTKRFFESGVFKQYKTDDAYIKELRDTKFELRKEKQKMFDERAALNRRIREQARAESFIEIITNKIATVKPLELKYQRKEFIESDNDIICHLTDIHAGININHWYNTFNMDVLKERLASYLDQLFDIQKRHNSQDCFLVIGEIISGLIHETLRVENNENVIEQFIQISTILTDVIAEISNLFNNVHVYVTPGNHSRCIQNKEHALRGENYDLLLPFYLKASLQNYKNVFIYDNLKDCDVAMFDVRGNKVMAVHGDKDTPESVVQKFTMVFGIKPDIVLLGHRHTNGLLTVYDSKVIQSGCVSGSDNYCVDRRLKNRAEQVISIVDHTGLVCLYDVKID